MGAMNDKLVEMLHLELEPVGIFLGNADAECDTLAQPGKRNCVVPFLLSAARGKVVGIDEEGCTCPGGTVGCCFGDGFTRKNPNIHKMLSQGLGDTAPPQAPIHLKEGERFFCDEETALKWRNSVPFSDAGYPRVVFAPQSRWSEIGEPDLVLVFANPDQLSALIVLHGYDKAEYDRVIATTASGCASMVRIPLNELKSDKPRAVITATDLAARKFVNEGEVAFAVTGPEFEKMLSVTEECFFHSPVWKPVRNRLRRDEHLEDAKFTGLA